MPMNITFRTQLLGGVKEFCIESGIPLATTEVVVDLIVRLARYREEGVELTPEVYLTDDIDLLVSMLPEGEKLSLSVTTGDAHGIEEMLKACAPLATGEWKIFGHHCEEGMNFGVFRGSSNPISVDMDDVVMNDQLEAAVIKAYQVAEACVHIRSSKGASHHIFFDHRREDSAPPLLYVEKLVQSIVRGVDEDEMEAVASFLKKTLVSTLLKSHGCILAVTNMTKPPKLLSNDSILLLEPIDFPSLIRRRKRERGLGTMPYGIERKAELLDGMICSDGVTLFDERGRLLGYRCFVHVPRSSRVVGGARRRAFATLKAHIGRGLAAVFMQSQDGWTDFEETFK